MLSDIKSIFAAEYAKAKKPEDKGGLARNLLKQAENTQDDSGTSFVLLKESQRLALEGADVETALKTVELLAADYRVDEVAMLHDVLDELSKDVKTPLAIRAVNEATKSTIENAVSADKYPVALKLCLVGAAIARKTKDTAEGKQYLDLKIAISALQKDFDAAEKAKAVLDKSPDDPAANFDRGVYLLQRKRQWVEGLQHLTKCSDNELRRLAKADLDEPKDSKAQLQLADGWYAWTLPSKKTKTAWTKALASYWYSKVVADLAGVDKIKVEKRLQELGDVELNRSEPVVAAISVPKKPAVPATPNPAGKAAGPVQPALANQPFYPLNNQQAKITMAIAEWASKTKGVIVGYSWARGSSIIDVSRPVPTEPFTINSISLNGSDLTDDHVKLLDGLATLNQFDNTAPNVSGDCLQYLRASTKLSSISFARQTALSDDLPKHLARFPKLHSLEIMSSSPLPAGTFQAIAALTELTSLTVRLGAEVPAAELQLLRKLRLQNLVLSDVDDDQMKALKDQLELLSLTIYSGQLSDVGLAPLKGMRNLSSLRVEKCPNVSGAFLMSLNQTPISTILFADVPLTDQALAAATKFPKLRELLLYRCVPVDSRCTFLKSAGGLQTLHLVEVNVPDWSFLGSLRQLRRLQVHGIAVSDEGVKLLSQLPLESIQFVRTPVTDGQLKQLNGHRTLNNITLLQTEVTPNAVDAMKVSLPKASVNYNR